MATALAGCRGSPDGASTDTDRPSDSPGTTTGTPAQLELRQSQRAPTCESTNFDHLLTIRPEGVTVVAEDRDAANAVYRDLRERVEAEDDLNSYQTDDGALVVVDAGLLGVEAVRESFADRSTVRSVYEGRPLLRVSDMADKAGNTLSSRLDPDRIAVTVVDDDTDHYFVVGLSGVGPDSIPTAWNGIEFRVAMDGSERALVGTGAIKSIESTDSKPPGVFLTLTDEGRERFASGLEAAGALENPNDASVRVYHGEDRIFDGSLERGLADMIESGEWPGEFELSVEDATKAEEVVAAVKYFVLSVETRTTLKAC